MPFDVGIHLAILDKHMQTEMVFVTRPRGLLTSPMLSKVVLAIAVPQTITASSVVAATMPSLPYFIRLHIHGGNNNST